MHPRAQELASDYAEAGAESKGTGEPAWPTPASLLKEDLEQIV